MTSRNKREGKYAGRYRGYHFRTRRTPLSKPYHAYRVTLTLDGKTFVCEPCSEDDLNIEIGGDNDEPK